jgi:SAM-dependent methyltransferase
MPGAAQRARDSIPLVDLARVLVTGSNPATHDRRLGAEIERGAHGFVLDIGCGDARVLRFTRPQRYVGLDLHRPSIQRARRRWGHRGGVELVEADITRTALGAWRGADVVVISNLLHHIADEEALALLDRVVGEVQPERILVQDAEPSGAMAPVVRALDGGENLRRRAQLLGLVEPRFDAREVERWSNRMRSFHYFLLELRPATGGTP